MHFINSLEKYCYFLCYGHVKSKVRYFGKVKYLISCGHTNSYVTAL